MTEAAGPTTYRVLLARELRAMREAAGTTPRKAAEALGSDASRISRIEQGQATLKSAEVDRLLELYSVSGEDAERVREYGAQARKRGKYGKAPDWARQYLGLERDAAALSVVSTELVHGLFQTEEYARAVISTSVLVAAADVDQLVASRMQRQSLLERKSGPELHLILGEAALRLQTGGPDVLAGQLRHLIELAGRPNITLQVLPFAAGEHASLGVKFTLLDLNVGDASTRWVYIEDLTSADCRSGEHHVRAYTMTFDSLRTNALGERETIRRLKQALREVEG